LFDVWVMGIFGLLGYLMRKLDFPAAALILGMVLGDALERALRQSLMMSQGDITILASRPISGTLLAIAAVILCLPALRKVRSWRVEAIERES
jgi:putative tricarboxylic transport membrane protein